MYNNITDKYNLKAELGQVWTPFDIALKMVQKSYQILKTYSNNNFSVLDPASGPATFQKAILHNGFPVSEMTCYDIDPDMTNITSGYLSTKEVSSKVLNADYLLDNTEKKFDLVILNPPYIRHEDLEINYKSSIKSVLESRAVKNINGRSNIFIYFLLKGLTELKENGVLCTIVYDSILYSQYGREFLKYAEKNFCIEYIEQIKTPFEKTLIDASIIVFRKASSPTEKGISFFNRNVDVKDGMSSLSDLLDISRGTSFPSREVFIARESDKFYEYAEPIVMKPADKKKGFVSSGDKKAYFFGVSKELDCFLKSICESKGVNNQKFSPKRGDILLNYYIRSEPKHLYNAKKIVASDNFYIGNIKGDFPAEVAWILLNSTEYKNRIMDVARNQGNGLKKLQAYEYKSAIVHDWRLMTDSLIRKYKSIACDLLEEKADIKTVNVIADRLCKEAFA